MDAVYADYRTAPISEKLRAALAVVEALTTDPAAVTADTLRPLRAAGASVHDIEDVIAVTTVFNLIDRVADALGFDIPSPKGFRTIAKGVLRFGYN